MKAERFTGKLGKVVKFSNNKFDKYPEDLAESIAFFAERVCENNEHNEVLNDDLSTWGSPTSGDIFSLSGFINALLAAQ